MAASGRSIRNRGRRKKIGPLELDITSLLDILVILLVFLLKSYNSSGISFNTRSVHLPRSESSSPNNPGVIVTVATDKIWVDDKAILEGEKTIKTSYDMDGKRIVPLYNELVKKKQMIERVEKSAPNAKKFSGIVNLLVDKTLKYTYLKKIMFTCAEAGFRKYKFVVLGENQ